MQLLQVQKYSRSYYSSNQCEIILFSANTTPKLHRTYIRLNQFLLTIRYRVHAYYRHLRISKRFTRIFGPQYVRSRDKIEIDLTYACNLQCIGCNRSVSQAPEIMHMSRDMIRDFVSESIKRGKQWKKIRLLGGEPTLHPEFHEILNDLLQYRNWHSDCEIEVATNGSGWAVEAVLKKIPIGIAIANSKKTSNVQPTFNSFNLAPVDDPAYRHANYKNGCSVMKEGIGLNPLGYYHCAVAGGIDRIEGNRLGCAHIPYDGDSMASVAERLCRLCGHFKDGHFIPVSLRPRMLEHKISPTWAFLYDKWRRDKLYQKNGRASNLTGYQRRYLPGSSPVFSQKEHLQDSVETTTTASQVL